LYVAEQFFAPDRCSAAAPHLQVKNSVGLKKGTMKVNTLSTLISFIFTILVLVICVKIFSGQVQIGDIAISFLLFLPAIAFIFAIAYLLSSNFLNKAQDRHLLQPQSRKKTQKKETPELRYYLPISYRILGILLLLSIVAISYLEYYMLSIFLTLSLIAYYLKTPYKIENKDGSLIIHHITGKKIMNKNDILSVKMGVFHNRVNCSKDHFYLSHFLTNIGFLTRNLAQETKKPVLGQAKSEMPVEVEISTSFLVNRAIVLFIFTILSSVFGVLYFINYVKQMH
jgi:hypothetical protein